MSAASCPGVLVSALILGLAALAGVACGEERMLPRLRPEVVEEAPATHPAMEEHFAAVLAVRDAVIAGDLEGVRRGAVWLAEEVSPIQYPPGWQWEIERMQGYAKDLATESELGGAALAAAALVGICGDCHRAFNVVVVPDVLVGGAGEGSPEGSALTAGSHAWGAERMWVGLVSPSEQAWVEGAQVFASAPWPSRVTGGGVAVRELGERAQGLAREGARVSGLGHREALLGELWMTCAACHRADGGRAPGK